MPSVAENVAPQRAERNPKGLSPGCFPYELLITQEDFASPRLSHVLARIHNAGTPPKGESNCLGYLPQRLELTVEAAT